MEEGQFPALVPSSILEPKHYVLVHGAGHGAWCWFKLRHLLESAGHRVSCLDLAGCGIDLTDPDSILSFEVYNKPLFDFMSNLARGRKVILVGHSAGGLSLSHSILEFGDKIEIAIFVAATMLQYGFCSDQDSKDGAPDLSDYGNIQDMKFSLGKDKPPTSVALRDDFQRKLLYQLSPIEDSLLASMLLRPTSAVALSKARFEKNKDNNLSKVTRVFIRTTYDNMVKPEQQDAMIRRWPPDEVMTIDTDHSPFFSAPHQLFELIIKASSSGIC